MQLQTRVKNAMRGLTQRWGTPNMKRRLWDMEYASGKWNHCEHTAKGGIYDFLEKYSRNGSILDMGCGSGNTGAELNTGSYHDYTGVDVSEVAVQKAARRSELTGRNGKNKYFQHDMLSYAPRQKHDVILFRESVHNIPQLKLKRTLDRYAQSLAEDGVLIVSLMRASERRYKEIIEWIAANYRVVEKYSSPGSDAFVIVFR